MAFEFRKLEIPDVILIEARSFEDERGYFMETYRKSDFELAGIFHEIVQDNHSFSRKGVVRGLHFQVNPHAQGKLVRVVSGRIFDVAVDIRRNSATFGRHVSCILSGENHRMLWIPPGFAHGFMALEDSHVHYKVTSEYNRDAESGIPWNDPVLGIPWPLKDPLISGKDLSYRTFEEQEVLF